MKCLLPPKGQPSQMESQGCVVNQHKPDTCEIILGTGGFCWGEYPLASTAKLFWFIVIIVSYTGGLCTKPLIYWLRKCVFWRRLKTFLYKFPSNDRLWYMELVIVRVDAHISKTGWTQRGGIGEKILILALICMATVLFWIWTAFRLCVCVCKGLIYKK